MGHPQRVTEPGLVYHVFNRRVMRLPLFQEDDDYLAFERVRGESLVRLDAPTGTPIPVDLAGRLRPAARLG